MAVTAKISVVTTVWQKKIAQYAATVGKGLPEAMTEEFPLLLRKVVDFTPPFKTGGAPGASDLSVGRAAVDRDIQKTMRPFDPKQVKTKALQRIIETKDIEAFNIMAARSKSGFLRGKRAVHFDPQHHLSRRNKRGRVGADTRQIVLGSDVALLKKYVAEVQGNVGTAKAGWMPAMEAVGAKSKLPAYVRRQTAHGAVIDDRKNEFNPSITAINRTPWAVRKDEGDRILADAKLSRIEAIIRKIKFEERKAAKAAKLAA